MIFSYSSIRKLFMKLGVNEREFIKYGFSYIRVFWKEGDEIGY